MIHLSVTRILVICLSIFFIIESIAILHSRNSAALENHQPVATTNSIPQESGFEIPGQELIPNLNEDPLSDSADQTINELTQTISTTEWLGPVAPIAVSPFFGITCLSGLAMFSDGMPWEGNRFISDNQFLSNPIVFWVFLILTLGTSLPRLTKVSKPVAQALDQVEAYSGVITLVALRVIAASSMAEPIGEEAAPAVAAAGIVSMSWDLLMIIAMAINLLVINSVKFFFEVLIWITPIPFVDAMLEAANKTFCAVLMAIYAFSPLLATIINLILFAVCAVAFRWIYRRVTMLRRMITDPLISLIFPSYGKLGDKLVVFPNAKFGDFPAKSRLLLHKIESGWILTMPRFLMSPKTQVINESDSQPQLQPGLLVNRIMFPGIEQTPLLFSRRHNLHLDELVEKFQLQKVDKSNKSESSPKVELA